MPMGVVARSQNYQSRLWVEGTVVNGDPLRFVQPVYIHIQSGNNSRTGPTTLYVSITSSFSPVLSTF